MDSNKLTGVSIWNRVQILTEEYRSLYAMLTFRLGAIDQRLPLVAGALTAILVSTPSLPEYQRLILLWLVPVACVWLHRIVLLHIQSKEDVLRRIAEIECQVNRLASSDLMVFQSQHPNRGVVGGRSGFGTVLGVLTVCLLAILISTGFMAGEFASDLALAGYFLYGIAASCHRSVQMQPVAVESKPARVDAQSLPHCVFFFKRPWVLVPLRGLILSPRDVGAGSSCR